MEDYGITEDEEEEGKRMIAELQLHGYGSQVLATSGPSSVDHIYTCERMTCLLNDLAEVTDLVMANFERNKCQTALQMLKLMFRKQTMTKSAVKETK